MTFTLFGKTMRILLAQINPTIGAIQGNAEKITASIKTAKKKGAQLVVFPELTLCGYPPEDLLLLPHFIDDLDNALKEIVEASKGIAVIIGTVRKNTFGGEKPLLNSAAVIDNGILLGFQDKILLPTYDVFDERRFFEPGHEMHLWNIHGHSIGVTICEDIWQHGKSLRYASYERDPVKDLYHLNPEFVINLSASPFSMSHAGDRLHVCSRVAKTLKCPFFLCNQVGGNDSLIFDGNSVYVDSQGRLIAQAKGFEEDFLLIDLDEKPVPKCFPHDPIEDLHKALVLGVRDYFYKSGFSKACLGLSGGIDSALVACIAVEALGKENVLGVLMPSRYTSKDSIDDAKALAKALEIEFKEISIEGPFRSYLETLSPLFADVAPDVTEENMQARIRGMLLMAISNKFGYIVLSTGNKSELAMGYSTLYGDMCGGLAVISDLTKQQVYALSHWINRKKMIIPQSTLQKAPSAELRPNQKDSDSLPDYAIIDNVLQAYVEDHQPAELIAKRFGYDLELVQDLVRRIHRSEYKRRQSPPGLRISEKAFTVGRHFPIVQRYIDN